MSEELRRGIIKGVFVPSDEPPRTKKQEEQITKEFERILQKDGVLKPGQTFEDVKREEAARKKQNS